MPNFTLTGTYNPWNQLYPQYLSERKTIQHSTFLQSNYGIGTFYTEPLRNLETIIKLNTDETTRNESYVVSLGSSENQIAACRTLRAFIYMHLTDALGMLPYRGSPEKATMAISSLNMIRKNLFWGSG